MKDYIFYGFWLLVVIALYVFMYFAPCHMVRKLPISAVRAECLEGIIK